MVSPAAAGCIARRDGRGEWRIAVYTAPAQCEGWWGRAVERWPCFAFQGFEWHAAFQATIGEAEHVAPQLVHVADEVGETMLLLPLGIYRERGMRVLRFLGGAVTDYNAPLIDPGLAAELVGGGMPALWDAILGLLPRVDLIWLRRMPESVEGTANPMITLTGAAVREPASAARLPPTMAEFRRTHRLDWADTRRRRRRLAEQGRVAFAIASGVDAQQRVLRALAPLKSRHWLRMGSPDWFARPGYLAFYQTLTATGLAEGEIHLSQLSLDDRVVAAHWGLVWRGRFYHLVTAYAEEWGRYAVGRLLIEHLVEWCIERGDIRIFDFTAGEEPYKREWTDHSFALYELIAARSMHGAAYLALMRLRDRLKRVSGLRNFVRRLRGRKPL